MVGKRLKSGEKKENHFLLKFLAYIFGSNQKKYYLCIRNQN